MALLDRHVAFVEALRTAGLPVSLAEGLDAVEAVTRIDLDDRELLRAAYAATVVKRQVHRPGFDRVFELFFPERVGGFATAAEAGSSTTADGPDDLADFRDRLADRLGNGGDGTDGGLGALAREAVDRFGRIRGRGEGEQRWSSYNVMNRVSPGDLVDKVLRGMASDLGVERRSVEQRVRRFERLVDDDVSRRAAEVRGPEYVARNTVRRSIDRIDFTAARREDLEQMRREIHPLARRLASRVDREQHGRRRGSLDMRRTMRASMSTGGVPLTTHLRPRRPGRTDLVVLCDVSGSVANFAGFTLMLVFALRAQFARVRAFTFVDEIHEITDQFRVDGDPVEVMTALAASAQHASLWGRTSYGRAFQRFREEHADALTPRTNLLVLGDARSNYTDLGIPALRQMLYDARQAWWLNPEHRRHWGTGDSAAHEYAQLLPMVECRNLTQLGEFVHDLA